METTTMTETTIPPTPLPVVDGQTPETPKAAKAKTAKKAAAKTAKKKTTTKKAAAPAAPAARFNRKLLSPAGRRGLDAVGYIRRHLIKPYALRGEQGIVDIVKEAAHLGRLELAALEAESQETK
jgi:hypothetical protein